MTAARLADVGLAFATLAARAQGTTVDYRLGSSFGPAYAALAPVSGQPCFVIPLVGGVHPTARCGGGCTLASAPSLRFDVAGRVWTQPAAVPECTDPTLLDVFVVLALDVAVKLDALGRSVTWRDVTTVVDDWQNLLAGRQHLSPEGQMGLWGEVWFILQSVEPDRLVRAWLGPEAESVDFLLDGAAAEIKTSRDRLAHFVSQKQLEDPVGDLPHVLRVTLGRRGSGSWRIAPADGRPPLGSRDRSRACAPIDTSRWVLRFGSGCLLAPVRASRAPAWFPSRAVPRVRAADPGVSRLRYRVQLDDDTRLGDDQYATARGRFFGENG